jgi:DNA-binding MarR family transcriptional regulator
MTIEKAINQKQFSNPHQKLMVNIAYTHSYLAGIINNDLKPFGISAEQYNVLRILRGVHPVSLSVGAITERMINKMSNASRLAEKLRKKGFVERKISEEDKRLVDITITKKGLRLLKQIDQELSDIQNIFGHLAVDEVELVNTILDKLRAPNE